MSKRIHPLPQHPEAKDGEICITNATIENYQRILWKTKRMGEHAFSRHGQPIPTLFPVFVQKKEYYDGAVD